MDLESFSLSRGLRGISIDLLIEVIFLVYADDIVVLADSRIDLQRIVNVIAEYCRLKSLEVNTSKTKTMDNR